MDVLLIDMLAQQRSRYFGAHDWARPVVEAILTLNPSRFYDLLVFTVSLAANAMERREGLTWLLIAARYGRRSSLAEIVGFAKSQPEDVQRLLLPVLLLDGGRAALALALARRRNKFYCVDYFGPGATVERPARTGQLAVAIRRSPMAPHESDE
ncbi:hypothetical protein V4889_13805 [Ralstonia solanacearum species complex bacterium KE101]|uniref:hypothetical protein n=1 Tax=Ralstonia solanacearum species complex TaxID=3116862 RepID=UPI0011C3D91D|nr:hypothetical protein [Ralstonia pseudosolanacearum]QKL57850.1 hypothetical protein HI814_14900 [Ralstonia solanacearum]MCK4129100.1 hypothetical protein [Ralstonia pseudosolanacearum]QKL62628.1 hypothetical protein HI812_13775 [Ralstonia solanacearum]QKL67432.1 hypothetical protein HI808_13775 [Ralstonia solanacearum]QKM33898.1 hypothetical protein HI794_14895 [Ralstonia solanacearum]